MNCLLHRKETESESQWLCTWHLLILFLFFLPFSSAASLYWDYKQAPPPCQTGIELRSLGLHKYFMHGAISLASHCSFPELSHAPAGTYSHRLPCLGENLLSHWQLPTAPAPLTFLS